MPKTYLPNIKGESQEEEPSGQNSDEDLMFWLLLSSPDQKRIRMERNVLLDLAAAIKAQEMAEKNYFSHTSPEGITANQNVRSVGFVLPDYYPVKGNNVESLSIGGNSLQSVVNGWFGSPKHRPHVFGENNFYLNQNCVGIGKAINRTDSRQIYVFISAPCP